MLKDRPRYAAFFFGLWGLMQQKIAVFSLSFTSPLWASAVFEDGYLTFGEVKAIPSKIHDQQNKVRPAVQKLMDSGFKVLVDEVSPLVTSGTGASMVRLAAKHHDDRPVLVVGLERYKELNRQGALVLPAKSGTRFNIPDDVVETEWNNSGDEVYRVNWASLTSEHVVVILACYATIFNPVSSTAYINAMNETPTSEPTPSLLAAFSRIVGNYMREQHKPDPERMAGKIIDENNRVL